MGTTRTVRLRMIAFALLVAACTSQPSTPNKQQATKPPPTSVSSESATTNGYSYGYGTYYVAARRTVPPHWGDAKMWYARAQAAGYAVGDTPRKGAIAWTGGGIHGQVAIVEEVSTDGTQVIISEMNGPGGWNRVTTRTVSASSFKYIY